MDIKIQFALFLVSFIFLVLATVNHPGPRPWLLWLPAGLAVFVFVFLGNAYMQM